MTPRHVLRHFLPDRRLLTATVNHRTWSARDRKTAAHENLVDGGAPWCQPATQLDLENALHLPVGADRRDAPRHEQLVPERDRSLLRPIAGLRLDARQGAAHGLLREGTESLLERVHLREVDGLARAVVDVLDVGTGTVGVVGQGAVPQAVPGELDRVQTVRAQPETTQ